MHHRPPSAAMHLHVRLRCGSSGSFASSEREKGKDQDALAVLIVPRALGQGADGITHEEVASSLPGSEKCKRKARDSG